MNVFASSWGACSIDLMCDGDTCNAESGNHDAQMEFAELHSVAVLVPDIELGTRPSSTGVVEGDSQQDRLTERTKGKIHLRSERGWGYSITLKSFKQVFIQNSRQFQEIGNLSTIIGVGLQWERLGVCQPNSCSPHHVSPLRRRRRSPWGRLPLCPGAALRWCSLHWWPYRQPVS